MNCIILLAFHFILSVSHNYDLAPLVALYSETDRNTSIVIEYITCSTMVRDRLVLSISVLILYPFRQHFLYLTLESRIFSSFISCLRFEWDNDW